MNVVHVFSKLVLAALKDQMVSSANELQMVIPSVEDTQLCNRLQGSNFAKTRFSAEVKRRLEGSCIPCLHTVTMFVNGSK